MRNPIFIPSHKRSIPVPLHKRLLAAGKALVAIGVLALCIPSVKEHTPYAVAVVLIVAGGILTMVDAFADFRRKRPRRRVLELTVFSFSIVVAFVVMACVMSADERTEWRFMAAFAGVVAIVCVWLFLRWRRLRAEAELRLWQLRQIRKKRSRL